MNAPHLRSAARSAQRQNGAWHLGAEMGQQLVLMPGQMYFGGRAASMKTLLGSCLALTLWHPGKRIGGMCHFLLPSRQRRPGEPLDGRYGDEAVEAMVSMLDLTGTRPTEYVAHLYGGADTMPEGGGVRFNVGERNIEQGWKLVDHYGFQLEGIDVGEDVPRTVTLTLATGEVDMRRGTGHAPQFTTKDLRKTAK
jgi:chemotaxis protein CheD